MYYLNGPLKPNLTQPNLTCPNLNFLLIFRLEIPQITAVSIETAFQNGGIAFILLRLSLPEPFGDLASVAPVAQLMITGQKNQFKLLWAPLNGTDYSK